MKLLKFAGKPSPKLPDAFTPATYSMSDIKRAEYAREIRRHEQSLALREKQIEDLIADQKDERAVLQSIRTAEACLNGPVFEAKVEKLLAENLDNLDPGFDTSATDALVEVEKTREEEVKIVRGSGDVFVDLGFTDEEGREIVTRKKAKMAVVRKEDAA